jgi:WD40-like Beta Propeller Repeat
MSDPRPLSRRIFLVGSLGTALTAGCGGGGQLSPEAPSGSGRAQFTILWPEIKSSTRLIPAAAKSITVKMVGPITIQKTIARPPVGTNQTEVTFDAIEIGSYSVTATAYPNTDGTGVAQATGATSLSIQKDQTATVDLALATTITRLSLSPTQTYVPLSGEVTFTVTAYNASGAVVLISDTTLLWSVTTNNLASYTTSNASIKIRGLSKGSMSFSVRETETNLELQKNLVVADDTPPNIAFIRTTNDSSVLAYDIYTLENGTYRNLTPDAVFNGSPESKAFYDSGPAWSPDGTKIAFSRSNNPYDNYRLCTINRDGSNLKYLTTADTLHHISPRWSPDGTQIAFLRGEIRGTVQIYRAHLLNLATGEITRLTLPYSQDWQEEERSVTWHPDGKSLLISRIGADGSRSGVFSINLADRSEKYIVGWWWDLHPTYTRDGSQILFYKDSNDSQARGIYLCLSDGSNPKQIYQAATDFFTIAPRVDAAGAFIYCAVNRGSSSNRKEEVVQMDFEGNIIRVLTNFIGSSISADIFS